MTLRVIRGAHERTSFDVPEAHRHTGFPQILEFRWRPVALDRQMHRRWAQVLPHREDVGALRRDVPHRRDDLVARLAETDHDPALADEFRSALLRPVEHLE